MSESGRSDLRISRKVPIALFYRYGARGLPCRCCTRQFLVNLLSSIVVELSCCCGLGVNLVALTISMDTPKIGVWVRKRVAAGCSFLLQPHDYTDSKKPAPSPSSRHRVCVCLILGLIYSPYTNHPLCFEF